MTAEPQYPDDAPIGQPVAAPAPEAPSADKEDAEASNARRTRQIVTGAAIGIGSAALVAALLYANRARKNNNKDEE